MRSLVTHLALASAGMAIWAWTVLSVQAPLFDLAALVVMTACWLVAGRPSRFRAKDPEGEDS